MYAIRSYYGDLDAAHEGTAAAAIVVVLRAREPVHRCGHRVVEFAKAAQPVDGCARERERERAVGHLGVDRNNFV